MGERGRPCNDFKPGGPNFTLTTAAVSPLTPETFRPHTATEERERVEATINATQGLKRARILEEHFNLDLNPGGE